MARMGAATAGIDKLFPWGYVMFILVRIVRQGMLLWNLLGICTGNTTLRMKAVQCEEITGLFLVT